ncbi:hypothetical protein [Streptomyces sp. NPDC056169]|uniref:hypothetical protein n=1 Tax=Streptomyces sp. NPDC056169 TaxID=3345734 RepID=UPI0035D58EA4
MSGEAFGFDDDSDEGIPEEWPTFYTPVPVWVLLCGCSAQGYRMYAFLAEHINNRTPGKRIAFPSQKAIARALKLKDYRDVAKYREELASVGAIRFEEFRYAGGMRRRYRYWVRFNPPEGYQGLTSLADFYEANPDVKSQGKESVKAAAEREGAGQSGGGKKPTSEGGKNPTLRGGKSPTAQQPDPQQPDPLEPQDAPPARSAPGRRQAPTGSRGPGEGGSAAPATSKLRLSKPQRDQVQAVRDLLPRELDAALGDRTPANVSAAVLAALATGQPRERTVQQLVEHRVLPRWNGYWAEQLLPAWKAERDAGRSPRAPFGPLVSMLKDTPECGSLVCDDRTDVHTRQPCGACAMRAEDRRASRQAGHERPEVPAAPTGGIPGPREHRPYQECSCGNPLPKDRDDDTCWECREQQEAEVVGAELASQWAAEEAYGAEQAAAGARFAAELDQEAAERAAREAADAQERAALAEERRRGAAEEDARLREEFARQNPDLAAYGSQGPAPF